MKILKHKRIENWESEQIENAIRRHTAKRNHSLNWISSIYHNMNKYYFLGVENDTTMNMTRVTTEFELFLPKIIIDFNKSDFTSYSIHLSLVYKAIFIFILMIFVSGIYHALFFSEFENLLYAPIFLIAFCFFTKWEINVTHKKILKTITQYHAKVE